MESQNPKKIGAPKELFPRMYGKTALLQKFYNPRLEREEDFLLFDFAGVPAIVFALTNDQRVIAVRQFRYAANTLVTELPGGSSEDGTPEETARRELEEETGYSPGEVIRLTEQPIWIDPAIYRTPFWPCLATGCEPRKKSKKRETSADEHDAALQVLTIPLAEWIARVEAGEIPDSKTITTTFLALPKIGLPSRRHH